jgi:hypothetical protein
MRLLYQIKRAYTREYDNFQPPTTLPHTPSTHTTTPEKQLTAQTSPYLPTKSIEFESQIHWLFLKVNAL